jgi:DNA helicase IV
MTNELFPDLDDEQAWLEHARRCRASMLARLRPLLVSTVGADEFTDEFVQYIARMQVDDLDDPRAANFFGRIDTETSERFHIGRRHIEGEEREPVVIDWRADIAAPFYRATVEDTFGLKLRRRFTLDNDRLVAYQDDHLDDPNAVGAGGIPDPVLAEIGAARTGAMRDIVATIQAEQDRVIRRPIHGCLIVQGGPGTGKTAVGLHRAAYLLFEHRVALSRQGVLVVGPNRVFLDYISHVLPSLGERAVQQRTIGDLSTPSVPVEGIDDDAISRIKGDARMALVIERAAIAAITVAKETLRVGVGSRSIVVTPELVQGWVDAALTSRQPLNRRRQAFRALALQELARGAPGGEDQVRANAPLKTLLDRSWPVVKARALIERILGNADALAAAAHGILDPGEQALIARRRKRWTTADLPLLDEATGVLEGAPATYGHIVVDEAQDLSAMGLRMLARRCPSGSFTVLGDLAQSTAPAGHTHWSDVAAQLAPAGDASIEQLTIGYRVPGPILEMANRLLPATGVVVGASRSARLDGEPPHVVFGTESHTVAAAVAADKRRHPLTGVIVPRERFAGIVAALEEHGLTAVDRLTDLGPHDVPLFAAADAKGLEFDAVVVVDPTAILGNSPIGARLLYVAMTRAVQRLTLVTDGPLPAVLTDERS